MNEIISAMHRVDRGLFLSINRMQTLWLNRFFSLFTHLGGTGFQTILVCWLIIWPSTRRTGFWLGGIQILVTALVHLGKRLTARARPFHVLTCVPLKREKDYSFPSGHSAAAFTTAVTMTGIIPSAAAFWFVLALLVGYSRIYLGVHYPSDVMAGSVIGIGVTILMIG